METVIWRWVVVQRNKMSEVQMVVCMNQNDTEDIWKLCICKSLQNGSDKWFVRVGDYLCRHSSLYIKATPRGVFVLLCTGMSCLPGYMHVFVWVAYQVLLSLSNVSHESVRMSPMLSPFSTLFRFTSFKSGPDGHGPLLKVAAFVHMLVLSLLSEKMFLAVEKYPCFCWPSSFVFSLLLPFTSV